MTFKEMIDMIKIQAGVGDKAGINGFIFAQMNLSLDWLRAHLLQFNPEILKTETDISLDGSTTAIDSQNLCSPTNYYIGDIVKVVWDDGTNKSTLERYPEIVTKSISGGYPLYYYKLGCTLYLKPAIQTSGTLKIVHFQKLKDFQTAFGATDVSAVMSEDFDFTRLFSGAPSNPYIEENITGFTNAFIYKVALDVTDNGDVAKALVEKLQQELMILMQNRPTKNRFKSPYERVWKEVK